MAGAQNAPERPRREVDPLVGTTLNGKFQILSVLANGGMGRIYRGEQLPLGRPVAIKVLHTQYTSSQEDPAFQRRFFLEASILSKLQHPNIVTVFDYGRIEGLENESYFMAMEFLQGETLHRRLKALGTLSPVEAIGLCRQMARGLREAHRSGVVHRDLKPSNVMLVPEEDGGELVKILDFGLVKVLTDESEELTKEGSFLGSPRYMSPEQIAHGKVDHRADIYSLGIILYHCLCGRTPFENENSVHTLMAHLQHPVPPMRERNPAIDVPAILEAFTLTCLAKDPNGRPSTMDDFLRGLRDCEQALGLSSLGTGSFSTGMSPTMLQAAGAYGAIEPSTPSQRSQSGSREALTFAPPPPMHPPLPAAAPSQPSVPTPAAAHVESGSSRNMLLGLVAFAVVASAIAMVFALSRSAAPQPPAPAPATAPAGPREYRLVIDSPVAGAQVFEGPSLLGATPLTLVVDNNAVRGEPRRLEVRHEGFAPYEVTAGPSADPSVRVVANLTARPAEAPAPPAAQPPPTHQGGARPNSRPQHPPTNTPPPPSDDEIRSHR